jgi:membrane protein YdbS with pleckstrin-like domain
MAEHCNECGAEVASGAVYCQVCGHRLNEDASPDGTGRAPDGGRDAPAERPAAAASPADKLRTRVEDRSAADEENEVQLWEGGYCGKAMVGTWILGGLATLVAAVIGFAFFRFLTGLYTTLIAAVVILGGVALLWLYRKARVHYILTNQRFIHREGILRRTTDRVEMIDIDDVTFDQGIVQRMLNVGNVKIVSSDRSHPELWLWGIDNVPEVAGRIDDVRREERRRRGLHIESI